MLESLFAALGFLAGWVGLVFLSVYLLLVSIWFDDDWWFRGILFIAVPIAIAMGINVLPIPSLESAIYLALTYMAIGVGWSLFRWLIFVNDLKKVVQKIMNEGYERIDYVNNNKVVKDCKWEEMTKAEKGTALVEDLFIGKYHRIYGTYLDMESVRQLDVAPKLSNNDLKQKVVFWIVYWPLSGLSYLFNRFLRDLFDFIVDKLKVIYNSIAAHIMKGLKV